MTELENSITSYFGKIPPEDLQTIVSFFKQETIKKNDYFLKTGKSCEKLSFVQSGFLRIFVETEKKDVTQWISTKGYFVTDLSSFVFGSPARWTIQALTDTTVQTIYKEDYQKLNELVPQWPLLEKIFIVRCFTFMEDRIFSHLSMTAEERYQFFFEHNRELFNQVPLQYIASMLGMTPETFSRVRKKMQ
jgi:CRP-like cAMP-binding protein